MLRRRQDNIVELQVLEAALARLAPTPLSAERREAIFERVFSQLGQQEAPRGPLLSALARPQWVAVPAGAALAVAIGIALADLLPEQGAQPRDAQLVASGQVLVNGQPVSEVRSGQLARALSHSWLSYGDLKVGLEPGSEVRFTESNGRLVLGLHGGDASIASPSRPVRVEGAGWAALLEAGGVGRFALSQGMLAVEVLDGEVWIETSLVSQRVTPADGRVFLPVSPVPTQHSANGSTPPIETVAGTPSEPGAQPAATQPGEGPAAAGADSAASAPPNVPPAQPPSQAAIPPQSAPPGASDSPAAEPPANPGPPADPGNGAGSPPLDPGSGGPPQEPPGQGTPPEDPGGGNGNPPVDPGTPPLDPPGSPPADTGGGNGNGTPPESPPGGGNGNAPDSPPANGNGPATPPGSGAPPEPKGNGQGNKSH